MVDNNVLLSSPENLSLLLKDAASGVLLSTDILNSFDRYKDLFSKEHVFPLEGSIYDPINRECCRVKWSDIGSLYKDLLGNLFSREFYLIVSDRFIIYNSFQSSLSVFIWDSERLYKYYNSWDTEFLKETDEIGIGFGQEGKQYLNRVLLDLSSKDARFFNLIK